MYRLNRFFLIPTTFVGLACAGVALADKEELELLSQTSISLTEAIDIAEKHQGGRAYEANLDDDRFSPEYEVGVAVGTVVYEVTVNGITGEVARVRTNNDND